MWRRVVTAMEEQFRPSIRKPLDLEEVKRLCEEAAKDRANDLCMLAVLNAHLGYSQEAIACCDRMQEVPPPKLATGLDWEERFKEFGRQLKAAILAGNERKFLENASAAGAEELFSS
jgi:hypothetical protein